MCKEEMSCKEEILFKSSHSYPNFSGGSYVEGVEELLDSLASLAKQHCLASQKRVGDSIQLLRCF